MNGIEGTYALKLPLSTPSLELAALHPCYLSLALSLLECVPRDQSVIPSIPLSLFMYLPLPPPLSVSVALSLCLSAGGKRKRAHCCTERGKEEGRVRR